MLICSINIKLILGLYLIANILLAPLGCNVSRQVFCELHVARYITRKKMIKVH